MNERIKQIRKNFNLTQEEFGARLGIKRNTVATYEMGRSTPIDAVVSLICREFNVNEEWLRTGKGEPYIALKNNDLIAKATALLGQNDPMFEAFIETYCNLSKENREAIYSMGVELLNNLNKTQN